MRTSGRSFGAIIATALGATALVLAPAPVRAADDADATCPTPPLTVTVLPGPIGTSGPAELAVTDAVTRRVAIVPRPSGPPRDAAALERLQEKAARTDLALYTMYLADFRVPRSALRGAGFGEVAAPDGHTVVAVTLVPTERRGFRAGDTAEVSPFAYDAQTTFAPLSLVTNSSGERSSYAYDGIDGGVEIRALGARSICLDMDVTFTYQGRPIAKVVGTVASPVVRAADAFFYT